MRQHTLNVSGAVCVRGALTAFAALFALGLAATPVLAQQGPGGRRMLSPDERLAQLTEQLDLTDEQATQMKPIIEEQSKKQQELFQNAGGDRATMRAEMTKLMEDTDKQYAEVLTEEQMNKYREMRQERMRQGRPPPPQGGR
ncbi:MAG: Spy/CpxP family protein refolding chaperone [Gemmatimonadetes bacterium]|jgi:Spy/CpxP family protein refolding chaperone|nr:Spy/CpxP family protein refolding chaperone [Gemmatimonadota bacterium]